MSRAQALAPPTLPSEKTVRFAQRALHLVEETKKSRFALVDRETGQDITIDETVHDLIRRLLIDLAQNRAVQIVPIAHELTTFEAADLLNVSRPFLVKLLTEGKIPFRMVGTHRRIRLEHLLAYQQTMLDESRAALDEIAQLEREMGREY